MEGSLWLVSALMLLLTTTGCLPSGSPPAVTSGAPSAVTPPSDAPAGGGADAKVPVASSSGAGGGAPANQAPCTRQSPAALTLGERTDVETGVRYRVDDAPLFVCVEWTAYPLMRSGHHQLSVSLLLDDGREQARFTPQPGERVAWNGYLIFWGLARPSHTAPGLWIRVEREPSNTR